MKRISLFDWQVIIVVAESDQQQEVISIRIFMQVVKFDHDGFYQKLISPDPDLAIHTQPINHLIQISLEKVGFP